MVRHAKIAIHVQRETPFASKLQKTLKNCILVSICLGHSVSGEWGVFKKSLLTLESGDVNVKGRVRGSGGRGRRRGRGSQAAGHQDIGHDDDDGTLAKGHQFKRSDSKECLKLGRGERDVWLNAVDVEFRVRQQRSLSRFSRFLARLKRAYIIQTSMKGFLSIKIKRKVFFCNESEFSGV